MPCHSAEEYVYAVLDHNGFKRSPNREFFEMPLRSAIEVLMVAQKELRERAETTSQTAQAVPSASEEGLDDDESSPHPAAAIVKKASDLYLGFRDEIQDKKEALRLLYKAKALNYAPAFAALADYFKEEAGWLNYYEDRLALQDLRDKALEVLKDGAQKGHGSCYVKMSEIYYHDWSLYLKSEPENANKCWKKYFRSSTFINDDDKWGSPFGFPSSTAEGIPRIEYARNYLYSVSLGSFALDPEIQQILLPLRAAIMENIKQSIHYAYQREQPDSRDLEYVNSLNLFLKFVESVL